MSSHGRGHATAPGAAHLIPLAFRRPHGRISAAAWAAGSSHSDMATSAVAGALQSQGGQAPIVTALADYLDRDDTSLFLRFQAVVIGAASQELFHRWHENDALSARLWRNLQRALRHDDRPPSPTHFWPWPRHRSP